MFNHIDLACFLPLFNAKAILNCFECLHCSGMFTYTCHFFFFFFVFHYLLNQLQSGFLSSTSVNLDQTSQSKFPMKLLNPLADCPQLTGVPAASDIDSYFLPTFFLGFCEVTFSGFSSSVSFAGSSFLKISKH